VALVEYSPVLANSISGLAVAAAEPLLAVDPPRFELLLLCLAPVMLVVLWWKDVIRPSSFERNPPRSVDHQPIAVWLLCGAAVLFGQMSAGLLSLKLPAEILGPAESLQHTAVRYLAIYAICLPLALVLFKLVNAGSADSKSGTLSPLGLLKGGLLLLAIYPILAGIGHLSMIVATHFGPGPPEAIAHTQLLLITQNATDPYGWILIACVIIGAPIFEEILYRGFVQSAVLRLCGSAWLSILITTALFTAIHLSVAQPHALPVLAALSIAMGIAFERSKSLAWPIGMHIVFNALNVTLAIAST